MIRSILPLAAVLGLLLAGCPPAAPEPDGPVPTSQGGDQDRDGLDAAVEALAGTDPLNPDTDGDGMTDGAELAAGTDPKSPDKPEAATAAEPVTAAEKAATAGADLWIGTVDEDGEDAASARLGALCTTDLSMTFSFEADDDDDEWKVRLVDAANETATYINLDDENTLEVGGPSNDFDLSPAATHGAAHRASIRVQGGYVSVSIDGRSVASGLPIGDFSRCLHPALELDDGVTLTKVNVHYQ